MPSIGDKIKFLRRRDGITTQNLAKAVGVPRDDMRAIERGDVDPTEDLTYRLAEYFDVGRGYFIPTEDGGDASPSGDEAGRSSSADEWDFTGFRYFQDEDDAAPPASPPPSGSPEPADASEDAPDSDLADEAPNADLADEAPGSALADEAPEATEPPTPPPATEPPSPEPPAAEDPPADGPRPPEPRPADEPEEAAVPSEKRLEPKAEVTGARTERGEVRLFVESRAADYILALVEMFIEKDYFTREEFEEALASVRDEARP